MSREPKYSLQYPAVLTYAYVRINNGPSRHERRKKAKLIKAAATKARLALRRDVGRALAKKAKHNARIAKNLKLASVYFNGNLIGQGRVQVTRD